MRSAEEYGEEIAMLVDGVTKLDKVTYGDAAQAETVTYDLEYGTASIELRTGTLPQGARVLIVDDVLATGGTAAAGVELVERCGGVVAGVAFLLELDGLGGRARLAGHQVDTLLRVES